jgi:hypothetical protein
MLQGSFLLFVIHFNHSTQQKGGVMNIKHETKSIGFACALGAFSGSLIALQLNVWFAWGSYFWFVGAIIGGLIAYCTIEFRAFCSGVRGAFKRTVAWKPNYAFWKAGLSFAFGLSVLMSWFTFPLSVVVAQEANKIGISTNIIAFVFMELSIFCVAFLLMAGPLLAVEDAKEYESIKKVGLTYLHWANPLIMIKGLHAGVAYLIALIYGATRNAVVILKQFAIETFIAVHSEERKICFVDAMLGATAGYFLGSPVLGALIGAVLGVVNYEVVSVRWLKLKPKRIGR